MSALIDFYTGTASDHRGRMLSTILAFNDEQLELTHDYIQWLFPTDQPSAFNAQAPVLTEPEIRAFKQSPHLQQRLGQALDRMLAFYGFQRRVNDATVLIREATNAEEQQTNWLRPGNHNHLRLTRILRACTLLGLAPSAQALLRSLEDIAAQHPHAISGDTEHYWRAALKQP